MNSQDPKLWGASAWKYLDAVASSIPSDWKKENMDKTLLYERISNFWTFLYLPCETCMEHYLTYLSEHPLDNALRTRDTFQQWYHHLKVYIAEHKVSKALPTPTMEPMGVQAHRVVSQPQVQPPMHVPPAVAPRAKAAAYAQFRNRFLKERTRPRVPSAVLSPNLPSIRNRPPSSSTDTKDPNHGARGCSSCSASTRMIQPRLGK